MMVDTQTWLAPFGIRVPSRQINGLTLDSREADRQTAFFAISGHARDGRDFIPQAVSLGAPLIIAEAEDQARHGEVEVREHSILLHYHGLPRAISALAGAFYGAPSEGLQVVAVTGTNGKTSTVQLCNQLLRHCGLLVGSVGTLGAGICGQVKRTANTTPDAISVQRWLATMLAQGATQVAIEASSHALVQGRIAAIRADVAVFTNLTHEHLDYHGDMQAYASAKRLLLSQPGLRFAVLNMHDPEHRNWLATMPESVTPVVFGIEQTPPEQGPYLIARELNFAANGVAFTLDSSWGQAKVQASLLGRFNVLNLLAALASQLCLGHQLSALVKATGALTPVAGRMEVFSNGTTHIVVDYAHTPDALEQALSSLRQHCHGRLWVIFGCGGDRDQDKRPHMGRIAATLADEVIITDDNARGESPAQIAKAIMAGCQGQAARYIAKRKEAIRTAVAAAGREDVILVAGKGHEDYQIINNKKVEYSEREFVAQLLEGKAS